MGWVFIEYWRLECDFWLEERGKEEGRKENRISKLLDFRYSLF